MKKLKLTNGKYAIVDDKDYLELSKYKWSLASNIYNYVHRVETNNKKTISIYLHRFLLNPPNNKQCDHINGNRLDNRRSNLRICTSSENQGNRKINKNNTSGFKGVWKPKNRKKWYSSIRKGEKMIFLGSFIKKREAAIAYNIAAKNYFNKFARLNKVNV